MAWRVNNWGAVYENNRSRELRKMEWVPIPNRMDGEGYAMLLAHKNGAAHYGAWVAIVLIASRCDQRGDLVRDGKALTIRSLVTISRIPAEVFEEAIPRLLSPDIGWLIQIDEPRVAADSNLDNRDSNLDNRQSSLDGELSILNSQDVDLDSPEAQTGREHSSLDSRDSNLDSEMDRPPAAFGLQGATFVGFPAGFPHRPMDSSHPHYNMNARGEWNGMEGNGMEGKKHTRPNAHSDAQVALFDLQPTALVPFQSQDPIGDWFKLKFWEMYPRRDAKQDALKAARQVLKGVRPSEVLAGLSRVLPKYQELIRTGRRHLVPLPASWIRGRRWEDEEPAGMPPVSQSGTESPTDRAIRLGRERILSEGRL